ncbi:hypothetical protein IFM89_031878 [Coptis chinensis]|uniref:Glutaredoxin domain-containing protein n=1 Tax=Coptis chinensis TaxID=261450 RepID=A0A835IRX5_9MAGN|nr:hypothetical protein IFM89_031878 [Coptis chinensis]
MARLLSNVLFRSIARAPETHSLRTMMVPGSFMRYSTTEPSDQDTHDDFKPTDKVSTSGVSLKDIVQKDVEENPVMIYMKGIPDSPMCGFSSLAVKVLNTYKVPLSARNILENPELKMPLKASVTGPHFHKYLSMGSSLEDLILFSACTSLES